MNLTRSPRALIALLSAAALPVWSPAQPAPVATNPAPVASTAPKSIADLDQANLAAFERRVVLAKELGATHVILTDDLPPATWEFEPKDDPYPAWFIQRPDFFKLFPPKEVQPFINMEHTRRVSAILEQRSKIVRKHGLKSHWSSNIPQVLPEAFFVAYPHLRGPRVDQPNRSRVARFSICVDQPDALRLYREAMQNLLARCPEIEGFAFLTQDSGSGFCWVPALYPGLNGHSDCKHRPMADRIAGFLNTLHAAARDSGHTIEISLNPITPRQWMLPSFSPEQLTAIAAQLPRGVAVQGREGPDGRPFQGTNTFEAYGRGPFYPVVGLAVPNLDARRRPAPAAPAAGEAARPVRRIFRIGGDDALQAFNVRLLRASEGWENRSRVERLNALRAFAVSEVGEEQADNLIEAWTLLKEAEHHLDALDFGDVIYFGHVLNRWANRPMVPFPAELSAEDKAYYRPYLFQAKGEEQAANLADIQAMRMYEGYGAKLLFQRVMETATPKVVQAREHVIRIREGMTAPEARQRWDLMSRRLQALVHLMHSADNMVAYQAQLDRVKSLGVKPEPNPVLGVQSSWDRTDLMETARKEIDNTVALVRLLESSPEPLLDLAQTQSEETIMRLGPDLIAQLKRKIAIMNQHWMDYDRLFSAPNP